MTIELVYQDSALRMAGCLSKFLQLNSLALTCSHVLVAIATLCLKHTINPVATCMNERLPYKTTPRGCLTGELA